MKLIRRSLYLDEMLEFEGVDVIKVLTGVRRCGKSTLLRLMIDELKSKGVKEDQIVFMNFESNVYQGMSSSELAETVNKKADNGKLYLFFDEIQMIENWQRAINSFRVDIDCDITITGSNAYLLSSELSTYLSGRYVEIKVLPLSFSEFLDMNELTIVDSLLEGNRIVRTPTGDLATIDSVFARYVKYGGMPMVSGLEQSQEVVSTVLDAIYNTVIVKDILDRGQREGQSVITDSMLLKKIIMFLADSIGSSISANNISNTLGSSGLVESKRKSGSPAVKTVQVYIEALLESYIFYEIKRYDIRGKQFLKTMGKYYMVDTGLRNHILGFREGDDGHLLENIVFFELLRQGYQVAVGKIDDKEIDFIATKNDEKKYIQVTQSIVSDTTRERELNPLTKIKDNHEKIVISMDNSLFDNIAGVKIVNVIDFLLGE